MYRRGDVLQRVEYAPFGGETFVLNPNLKLNPSYTGQKYDVESGLYYYKARYYNPEIGRFIQADTAIQDKHDLQAYNRYAYVRNNPLKYTDPTGHFWFAFLFAIILGAALGAVSAAIFGGNILMGALQGMITGAIFFGAGEIIQGMSITSQLVKAGIHAAAGAISGAINSAISGQSLAGIGRSALIGAISAGVLRYADKYLNDNNFRMRLLGRTLIGAATGATASVIMGGNILQGAWIGGATAAAGTIFNDFLHFDGKKVSLYNDKGELLGEYDATSGRNGETDQALKNQGPIPEGNYTINPSEIQQRSVLSRVASLFGVRADWGKYLVPLHPVDGTDTFGRSGFYLHGGILPGSAGCIDVGGGDSGLFSQIQGHSRPINVEVHYGH